MATQDLCATFTTTVKFSSESAQDEVECQVTITNNDDEDYLLLRRYTPLEGLKSDIFNVTKREKRIPYNGILLKRGRPSQEEYDLIKAKSSLGSKVNLSHAYRIDSPGIYTVQLKMSLKFHEHKDSGTRFTQKVESNTITTDGELTPSGKEPEGTRGTPDCKKKPSATSGPKSPLLVGNYPNLGDKEETQEAYRRAYSAIEKSIPSTTENPELYEEWFGNPYRPIVKSNYTTMKSTMERKEFTLHARPTKEENGDTPDTRYYGFTYYKNKEHPNIIYLGDHYFAAGLEGTDSKMGTIVHEMSHAAAGTKDVKQDGDEDEVYGQDGDAVYGQEDCQKLAMDHSEKAIINADNYEYFSEAQI